MHRPGSPQVLDKFLRLLLKQEPRPEGWKTPEYLGVRYDPSLVQALTHQHRALSVLLVEASSAAQLGSFDEVGEILEQFAGALADHLHQERERLHPYLAEHIQGEEGDTVLREMYTQVALVKHSVTTFLKRYGNTPLDASNLAEFEQDIEAMSDEFSQEMEREEAIFYTLYLPPEAY